MKFRNYLTEAKPEIEQNYRKKNRVHILFPNEEPVDTMKAYVEDNKISFKKWGRLAGFDKGAFWLDFKSTKDAEAFLKSKGLK